MWFRYRAGEVVRTVRVEPHAAGYRVDVDDRSFEVVVRRSDGPALDLLVDARPLEAIVVFDGESRIVKLRDLDPVTLLEVSRARRESRSAGAVDGRLAAAMDGQVLAVPARPGERVEAGATLVVLEAMKMEMRVVAPFAGRVREVSCAPGEVVERGRILVVLDPAAEGEMSSAGQPSDS